jgi:hypothetical protein
MNMKLTKRDTFLMATTAIAAAGLGSMATSAANPEVSPNPTRFTEKLSRSNCAVVLVDYLDGFMPGMKTVPPAMFRKNAEAFARLSETFKLPTIMLGEEGGFRGKFFPEVIKHSKHAVSVERHNPSAWDEPKFREVLAGFGRRKVLLGGISLDICTLQLTLDLLGAGYEPYVVVDASGSDTLLNEQAAIQRMTQAGAVMVNWGSVASEIMQDWQTPEGPIVGELYQNYSQWGNRF